MGRNANNEIIPWQTTGSLSQARAFASSVTIEVEFNNTIFYILGGYEMVVGFLDSVEVYDKNAGTFSVKPEMQMPQRKSHLCTLLVEVRIFSSSFLASSCGSNCDIIANWRAHGAFLLYYFCINCHNINYEPMHSACRKRQNSPV